MYPLNDYSHTLNHKIHTFDLSLFYLHERILIVNQSQNHSIVGVVLAAGKSTRMKTDKAFLKYHQKPQYEYVAQELKQFCDQVYINGNAKHYHSIFKVFEDDSELKNHGPISGVLSAKKRFPGNSLFIHACDYPYITTNSLAKLFNAFLEHQKTICFRNTSSQFIEPLIAIYHENDLIKLVEFYNNGQTSLRVFLTSINAVILDNIDNAELLSVDEPL